MFDTMTLTKIVGGVCGALLIFLLINAGAESFYTMGGGHGGEHQQAYVIDTGAEDQGDTAAAEEGPTLAELLASADVEKGKKVFGKCKACHKLEDGANATGPFLYGVVGRPAGSAPGYSYSGALTAVVDVWTPEHLDAFLSGPKAFTPGTAMGFKGLSKATDRANVIMFLDQLDGDVYQMEAPAADTHDDAAAEGATEEPAAVVEEAAAAVETATAATDVAAAATEEAAAAATDVAAAATEEATAAATDVAAAATEEAAAAATDAASTATADATGAAASGGSEFATMVAGADIAAGEKIFRRCKSCHKLKEGARGVGPHLYGVVGRGVATVDGYKYSDALKSVGGEWTADRLDQWLTSPRKFAKGTKMSFSGLKDMQDRANVVAYLASVPN